MSFLSRIFSGKAGRSDYRPLYDSIVGYGRDKDWYREGQVPDSIDGRFDMIAAVLALVLLRLEREGKDASQASVLLAELFIEDMDGSIRQMGIGDLMVGKHVGNMMGALGGRLAAFRVALTKSEGFEAVVRRNIFHDDPPSQQALAFVARRLEHYHEALAGQPAPSLLAGEMPKP